MSKIPCPKCRGQMDRQAKLCGPCRGYGRKRHTMPSGYIRVYVPGHPAANSDGYALEHRYVAHEAGWTIPAGSHVHHKNGIKDDNRLENLEVLKASEHHRQHIAAAGVVTNQYGTFPVLHDPEARRERVSRRNQAKLEYKREWRRRRRAEQRAA
jgi:hypothetical protein